jgi:hypothetical protein
MVGRAGFQLAIRDLKDRCFRATKLPTQNLAGWRGFEPLVVVLETTGFAINRPALTFLYTIDPENKMERETGFKPATYCLEGNHSITELLPPIPLKSPYQFHI